MGVNTDTEARLEQIAARLAKATEGPWEAFPDPTWGDAVWSVGTPQQQVDEEPLAESLLRADAEFIAASRQDIPFLLAEVERLQGDVAHLLGLNEIRRQEIERLGEHRRAEVARLREAVEQGRTVIEAIRPFILKAPTPIQEAFVEYELWEGRAALAGQEGSP